jgi:hypothetical protein
MDRTVWRWVIITTGIATLLILGSFINSAVGWDLDGETFVLRIVNDTDEDVFMRYRPADDCEPLDKQFRFEARESFKINAVVHKRFSETYELRDEQGGLFGCLHLRFLQRRPKDLRTVYVSRATEC